MTEQEYLQSRVQDQISWYERKSAWNKKWFTRLKIGETVLALMIPFLSGCLTDTNSFKLKIWIGLVGVIVAAIANLLTILKLQENWIQYRTIAESLKREQFLFITKSGPYRRASYPFFVDRIESLLSQESAQWISYVSTKEKGDEKSKRADGIDNEASTEPPYDEQS